jgi:hypothetical protein
MYYSLAVTEKNQHCLDFWLSQHGGKSEGFQCMPCCILQSFVFSLIHCRSAQTSSSWLLVRFLGTIFTQIFLIPNFFNTVIHTEPLSMWIMFSGSYNM